MLLKRVDNHKNEKEGGGVISNSKRIAQIFIKAPDIVQIQAHLNHDGGGGCREGP
jgi:hypothetical protein